MPPIRVEGKVYRSGYNYGVEFVGQEATLGSYLFRDNIFLALSLRIPTPHSSKPYHLLERKKRGSAFTTL